MRIRDLVYPGSGINISDPQHWLKVRENMGHPVPVQNIHDPIILLSMLKEKKEIIL
jgi:hypothetical protein